MPSFDPELTAALGVVRHVRGGCTTGAAMLQRLKPYYQRWYNDRLGGATRPFYVLNSRV
jgi:hypothetical protein